MRTAMPINKRTMKKTDTPYYHVYATTSGAEELKLLAALEQCTKDMTEDRSLENIITFLRSIETEDTDIKQYVSSMLSAAWQLLSIRHRSQLENAITNFFNH